VNKKEELLKLTILTYNINKSRNWFFRDTPRNILRNLILDRKADIIFLQEFSGENRENYLGDLEAFADGIWSDFAYGKNSIYENGHHGNAILSRFPIVAWDNTNISTNPLEKRGLLYAKVSLPSTRGSKEVGLYCVHLDLLQRGRNKQMATIVEKVRERSTDTPYIIAGDFNDWNFKLDRLIEKSLGIYDSSYNVNGKFTKTFPSYFPILCLDRIYTKGLVPLKTFNHQNNNIVLLSDHLPVMTDVVLSE
jgi:endonuclease/exonuclease/phosphatase family metal-dependent hydrolase